MADIRIGGFIVIKKFIFIIGIVLFSNFLWSCSNGNTNNKSYGDIDFEMANYYQDFDRTVEYVDDINWIPNKETAVSVALSIFDGMKKSYEEKKYEPQRVYYDESNGVWIVVFYEPIDPNADVVRVGGDIYIALSEKTGEVLSVFLGE